MIISNDYIGMNKAPKSGILVCLDIGVCMGSENDVKFKVPKFTNQFDLGHL